MKFENDMPINERLFLLIQDLDANPNSFAESLGVKGTVIHNIIKGRMSKPSFDLLEKIMQNYPTLNTNWLILGRGEMWVENEVDKSVTSLEDRVETLLTKLKGKYNHTGLHEASEFITDFIEEQRIP